MVKKSKRYRQSSQYVTKNHIYKIDDAIALLKTIITKNPTRFDQTVEVAFNLNVDPRKADQMLRGTINLPAGTGKKRKILVLTTTKQEEALSCDVAYVRGPEVITEIQKGWLDFDVMIATTEMKDELKKVARILGPKGLMPNEKLGTIGNDVKKTITEIQKGKVEYRVDKNGNIHVILGKVSFGNDKIKENYQAVLSTIKKIKPAKVKGDYIKNITIAATMTPGIKITIQ